MKGWVKESSAQGLALRDVGSPRVSQPDYELFRVGCRPIWIGELRVVAWATWAQEDPTLEIPTVLGHAASGVVVEVGPDLRQLKPGSWHPNAVQQLPPHHGPPHDEHLHWLPATGHHGCGGDPTRHITYSLPIGVNVRFSDAKVPDAQAGMGKATTMLVGALAGADIFGAMGIAGMDQGFSLPQLIIDDQIIACVKELVRGMAADEDTLEVEVIERVGIGGNCLSDDQTPARWRDEF